MPLALTVTHAFGDREVGETITDKAAIKEALETNPGFVVRVNLPTETTSAQSAAKPPAKHDAA